MNNFPNNTPGTCSSNVWRGLFLSLFFIVCTGCPTKHLPPVSTYDFFSPEEYIAHQVALQSSVYSLRAVARATVNSRGEAGSAEEIILVRFPDRLRMEFLNFFGIPVVYFSLKGNDLTVLSQREDVCWQGEATEENLGQFLPVSISQKNITYFLLGQVQLSEGDKGEWLDKSQANSVTMVIREGRRKKKRHLTFSSETHLLSAVEVHNKSGVLLWRAFFSDYRMVEEIPFPFSLRLEAPVTDTWLEIDYDEVELNASLDDRLFELEIPEGVEIIELERGREMRGRLIDD